MTRKDLPIFISLIAFVLLWPVIDRTFIAPMFPAPPPPAETDAGGPGTDAAPDPAVPGEEDPARLGPATGPETTPGAAEEEGETIPADPGTLVTLSTDSAEWTFQTRGAGLASVRMNDYHTTPDPESPIVTLDFEAAPALVWEDLPGLGAAGEFEVDRDPDGKTLRFLRRTASGLELRREVQVVSEHLLRVRDEFRNTGTTPAEVPAARLRSGEMRTLAGESRMSGVATIGLDTLAPGGEKVKYWGRDIPGWFKKAPPTPSGRPPVRLPRDILSGPVEWAAAKNKYFVQIIQPLTAPATGVEGAFERAVGEKEKNDPNFRKIKPEAAAVALRLRFGGAVLPPAGEPLVREFEYYAGPKKYDLLKSLTHRRVDVMEFGFFGGLSRILLVVLKAIHRVIPNYGVAIILLTILVRIVFWPITHKGTQSMKRMAEIQPLMKEIREKYKDPQRQQKEIMALYKQHKINPLGGCLPMLVQIPVFIALFHMLRSAIELRFAPFLWVNDLSEPENLLAGMIPLVGSLNILPLLMTVTQIWQQKLTPAAGDPSQQKMMQWMPIMMLVFFYHFASGLVLYWTTNQVLMIVQLYLQKYRREHAAAKPA